MSSPLPFHGVYTALVTPLSEQSVHWDELDRLVDYQIAQGITGLVAVGTTGESPTLDHDEHIAVIQRVVQRAAGRVPVLAGTGSNSTQEALDLQQRAEAVGADGFLIVAPYYNKPTPEGLYRHFARLAEATTKPIMLYSIPGRCGIEIGVDVVARLAERYPHVAALKEAGGSADRVSQVLAATGDRFTVMSGDDNLTLPFLALGARGVVSVASNLVVANLVRLVAAANAGDFATARALHYRYYRFFKDIFIEANPGPIKAALVRAGLLSSAYVREPLCEMQPANLARLHATMAAVGL